MVRCRLGLFSSCFELSFLPKGCFLLVLFFNASFVLRCALRLAIAHMSFFDLELYTLYIVTFIISTLFLDEFEKILLRNWEGG